jgi:hypothetical protein
MRIFWYILPFLFLSIAVSARTITASGGSNSNVQSAIDSAASGDTVQVPSGNYTWTGGITCNQAITIDGSGSTITHNAGSGNLFNLTTSSAGHLSVANIKFQPGAATGRYISIGAGAGGQGIILHDLSFEIPNFQLTTAITSKMLGGLIYNCVFESHASSASSGPGSGSGCLQVSSPKDWYDADTFGTMDRNGDHNLYVEDCVFRDMYNQAIDLDDNCRLVLRHCQLINSQCVTHGITSMWGGRQFEAYNNAFIYEKRNGTWVNTNRFFWARAGTGRIHDNTVDKVDSGGYWGGWKPSFVFIAEPLTRSGSGNGGVCEKESDYLGTRWVGSGTDGTKHPSGEIVRNSPSDPFYFWNNSGGGANSWGVNDQTGYGCSGGSTKNVFKEGRDIIFAAAPGYAEFTYPHPWRSGAGPIPTPAPTVTPSPMPTPPSPTPTPTPQPTPPMPSGGEYSQWLDELGAWIEAHPAHKNPTPESQGTEPFIEGR